MAVSLPRPLIQLSSSGLTGRSSTPRPLDDSQASLEYWVARSSRAMTGESVARFLRRHCEERLSAEAHRAKAEATKQSIEPQRKLDCFVARAPRNDDDTCLRDLATRSARAVHESLALRNRGRRECRALDAPAASHAK